MKKIETVLITGAGGYVGSMLTSNCSLNER